MTRFVTDDKLSLHVETVGADDWPVVVLVHGLAASVRLSWQMTGVLDRLVEHGLRVVAYDARGHGASDAPHDPDLYGDDRLVADLIGITEQFGGPSPVIAGYSMGAAMTLLALSRGFSVGGACVAGAPRAVFGWTQADEDQRAFAIDALEGPGPSSDPMMQAWMAFLNATGTDKLALAALLRGHEPVIERWDQIDVPIVVGAGINDATAAEPDKIVARLSLGRAIQIPGDHVAALAAPAFTDAIAELAHSGAGPHPAP